MTKYPSAQAEGGSLKQCGKCGKSKPVSEFHKNKNARDGLTFRCKNCQRIYHREYRAANADKRKGYNTAYDIARRARERDADGNATAEQIRGRCELYGETCYICGFPAEAIDHVIPLAAGGTNWPANLRPICKTCNSIKAREWPCDFVAISFRRAQIEHGLRRDGKDPDLWPGPV